MCVCVCVCVCVCIPGIPYITFFDPHEENSLEIIQNDLFWKSKDRKYSLYGIKTITPMECPHKT